MKVVISGGHLTPALALISYLQTTHPDVEIVFVGRELSQEGAHQKSNERAEISAKHIPFIPLDAPRFSLSGGMGIVRLWNTYRQARVILKEHQPTVFVSFGGYLAVPLALAARSLSIPVITHEQTQSPGIANRFIGFFAQGIAVSFPETARFFSAKKTVVTGNPLRPELSEPNPIAPQWITSEILSGELPVLYVTGGNQGSATLNQLVMDCLPELTQTWYVIHQCGNDTRERRYFEELTAAQTALPTAQRMRYAVQPWVTARELAWIYQNTTCLLSRSGANTIQEIQYFGIPSILVPLPSARNNEQLLNAQVLTNAAGAVLLPQESASPTTLMSALSHVRIHHAALKKNAKQSQTVDPTRAAEQLWHLVMKSV